MQGLLHVLWVMSFSSLLLLPAALMFLRWFRPKAMPTWAIIAILMGGGWIIANITVHVHQAYLTRIVMSMPDLDPDDPVARRWAADGARMLFALLFGWLYGPVLWVLWSPLFGIVWLSRRIRAQRAVA